jgi:hypothetical protein
VLILGTAWESFSTRSVAPTASWCVVALTALTRNSHGPTPTPSGTLHMRCRADDDLSTKPREDPVERIERSQLIPGVLRTRGDARMELERAGSGLK